MNNETQRKAQQNTVTYKLVVFDPGNAGYGVSESQFSKIFLVEHAPGPPYIIRGIRADSLFGA